ncbi:hypothetical protein BLOT_001388 [Blomia tropicalis]|nr:hypothetical protein BLOT_001388 [Blomia tropicalis]
MNRSLVRRSTVDKQTKVVSNGHSSWHGSSNTNNNGSRINCSAIANRLRSALFKCCTSQLALVLNATSAITCLTRIRIGIHEPSPIRLGIGCRIVIRAIYVNVCRTLSNVMFGQYGSLTVHNRKVCIN